MQLETWQWMASFQNLTSMGVKLQRGSPLSPLFLDGGKRERERVCAGLLFPSGSNIQWCIFVPLVLLTIPGGEGRAVGGNGHLVF